MGRFDPAWDVPYDAQLPGVPSGYNWVNDGLSHERTREVRWELGWGG
jgi:hypothetical protein